MLAGQLRGAGKAEPRFVYLNRLRSLPWRLTVGDTSATVTGLGWALFVLLMVLLIGQAFIPVMEQDEGLLLEYPWLIARGAMPYRDFWMMYPPATFLALAGLIKVGVPGLVAERGFSIAMRMLYPLMVNRACTGSFKRFSWLGVIPAFGLMFMSANSGMIRAYPWTMGIVVYLAGLLLLQSSPRRAAFLFLLASLMRFEYLVAGMVALGVLAVLDGRRRGEYVKAGALLLAGAGLCYGVLDLITSGAAAEQIFVDAMVRIPPGRSLPFRPFELLPLLLLLEGIVLIGPPLLALAGLLYHRPYIVATNLSTTPLLSHFLQRANNDYLYNTAALVVPWLVISAVVLAATEGAGRRTQQRPAWATQGLLGLVGTVVGWLIVPLLTAYAVALSPLSPLSPSSLAELSGRLVSDGNRAIITASRRSAQDDRQILAYLRYHATPVQRIYVSPIDLRHAMWNNTEMYFLLGLRPGTRYLEMNPGIETRAVVQREIIRGLKHTTWVLLWRGGFWYEPNASQKLGAPLLARYIPTHYRLVLRNESYELLRRSERRGIESSRSQRLGLDFPGEVCRMKGRGTAYVSKEAYCGCSGTAPSRKVAPHRAKREGRRT